MWADPNDLAGVGCIDCFLGAGDEAGLDAAAKMLSQQGPPEPFLVKQAASTGEKVAVKPTTQDQIFNLINTVAKGILSERLASQQTKLSTAQAAAAAQQSKVQAQNYVMQQLKSGNAVMVDKGWLDKFSASSSAVKWGTTALIVGGVALLGYALFKRSKRSKR